MLIPIAMKVRITMCMSNSKDQKGMFKEASVAVNVVLLLYTLPVFIALEKIKLFF